MERSEVVLSRIDRNVQKILRSVESQQTDDWINEQEVAELFGVTVKTIHNKVYNGTIPSNAFKKSVVGTRMYNKRILLQF